MLLLMFAAADALDTFVTASLEVPSLDSDVLKEVSSGSRLISNAEDMPTRLVLPSAN